MSNTTEMTKTTELINMELCYTKLVHATTSVARREFFVNCLSLYKKSSSVKERWAYHPSAHQYKDRFCKRRIPLTKKKKIQSTRINHCNNSDYYDDRIDYSVPEGRGLYFIGGTRYDRDLQKVIHVVKIGKSTNLPKRMDGYNSMNPLLWRCGFSKEYDKETYYHSLLREKSIARCKGSKEWFIVSEETYYEMCAKGFSYFD